METTKCLKSARTIAAACIFLFLAASASRSAVAEASPENQVFQWMQSGACTAWSDGSMNKATAYLWIPENCQRVRGLLILCPNVPEHRLVGHPAIREACAANGLGIVWCAPSFMNFRKDDAKGTNMAKESKTAVAFLQQLLDGLAQISGYEEIATVPWLPMGESGHLLMVDALVEEMPQRCIAGVWIKNNHLPPKNRDTPALVIYGTAQEWAQEKTDVRKKWSEVWPAYDGVLAQRKAHSAWPLTFVMDGTSGHFDCSERLTRYIARYIGWAAKARLPADGSALKPIALESGCVAGLAVPNHAAQPVKTGAAAEPLPWYPDRASAEEAQAIAAINWEADTQLPAFADAAGKILPFDFNGISSVMPETEADGITFTLRGVLLNALPANFLGADEPLAKAPGAPAIEWLCGAVAPLGGNKFRISLDRSWPSACYFAARQDGTDKIRGVVQPIAINLKKNDQGAVQKITFGPIANIRAGTKSIPLIAKSSAGLPVRFFVRSGPAEIHDAQLVFTPIPPRTKFPVNVSVAAWQWGSSAAPQVKTAELVEQSFSITR